MPYNYNIDYNLNCAAMKLNKKFIFILSLVYFFFSLGIGNYALCMGLCNKNETSVRTIRCACCAHKQKHCNCLKKMRSPFTINSQSANYANYTIYIQNICKKTSLISYLVRYKDVYNDKIKSQQTLLVNENLIMLRSVILLD